VNNSIIREYTDRSLAGNITFLEVLQKLKAVGTKRYIVDLIGNRVAREFDDGAVKSAIVDIQQRRINYREFLNRIMSAG